MPGKFVFLSSIFPLTSSWPDSFYECLISHFMQLGSTEFIESAPLALLPRGTIVEVLESKISPQLGLLVCHVVPHSQNRSDEIVQG